MSAALQTGLWDLPEPVARLPVQPWDAPVDDVGYTQWGVYVVCHNEQHQAEVLEQLHTHGMQVRAV